MKRQPNLNTTAYRFPGRFLGRLLGLLLALGVLLSAFPPAVHPARAQEPAWAEVPLPATVGLGAVRALAQADESAAFAVVSRPLDASYLVKTEDGGERWVGVGHLDATSSLRPAGLAADLGEETTVVLLAASPSFSRDRTLFLAITELDGKDDGAQTPDDNISQIFRSEDGGATFVQVGANLPGAVILKVLTLAPGYARTQDYTVLVGTAGPEDNQRGQLYRLEATQGAPAWAPWGPQGDYYAAAFFPVSPKEVMVVAASDHGPEQDAIREYRIVDITRPSPSATLYLALIAGETTSTAFEPALSQAPVETDNSAIVTLPTGWTPQTALDRELVTFSTGNGAGGLYRRTSPLSIVAVTTGLPRGDYHSLALQGTATTGVALMGGDLGTVWRSPDGGLSWAQVPGSPGGGVDGERGPVWVTLVGGKGLAATAGRGGGLFRTRDGGATWAATILTTEDLVSEVLAVATAGEESLLVLGRSRADDTRSLFRTTDDGLSWALVARYSGLDTILVSPAYLQDNTLYLAARRNLHGQLYRSSDGGKTFAARADPGSGQTLASIVALDANTIAVSLVSGLVVSSDDGGATWKRAAVSPSAPMVSMRGDAAGQRLVGITAGREVFYSPDRGATWSAVGVAGFAGEGKDVAFHPYFPRNNMVLAAVAGGPPASLFRSEIRTGNWVNSSPGGLTGALALSAAGATLWVLGPPGFIYSAFGAVDGPLAWRALPPPGIPAAPERGLLALSYHPDTRESRIYLMGEKGGGRPYIVKLSDDVTPPVPTEPADRAQGLSSPAVLLWAPVAGAAEYEVQLGISRELGGAQLKTTSVLGVETTQWYPQGMLDGLVYYWRVRVTRPLSSDWSRTFSFTIGTPRVDPSPTVAQALASLGDAYDEVWGFDAATQEWLVSKPGAPDFANTLARLEPRQGYWIHMKREARLTYGAAIYSLQRGFNLIGWTGGQ